MHAMLVAFPSVTITHTEVWAIIVLTAFVVLAIKACRGFKLPDPGSVQGYATLANSKGGLVLLMTFMWFFTLVSTAAFTVWILIRGVDPQNAQVITLTGMFISQAFGTVNGALFKTMTGEDPKPPSPLPLIPVVPPAAPPVQP